MVKLNVYIYVAINAGWQEIKGSPCHPPKVSTASGTMAIPSAARGETPQPKLHPSSSSQAIAINPFSSVSFPFVYFHSCLSIFSLIKDRLIKAKPSFWCKLGLELQNPRQGPRLTLGSHFQKHCIAPHLPPFPSTINVSFQKSKWVGEPDYRFPATPATQMSCAPSVFW